MSEFTQTEVEGHQVSVMDDGSCWWCEDATPSVASYVIVGPMQMHIGVCEECHDELEEQA